MKRILAMTWFVALPNFNVISLTLNLSFQQEIKEKLILINQAYFKFISLSNVGERGLKEKNARKYAYRNLLSH